jgi:hypothetical protein
MNKQTIAQKARDILSSDKSIKNMDVKINGSVEVAFEKESIYPYVFKGKFNSLEELDRLYSYMEKKKPPE